jgi:hypothetical protein
MSNLSFLADARAARVGLELRRSGCLVDHPSGGASVRCPRGPALYVCDTETGYLCILGLSPETISACRMTLADLKLTPMRLAVGLGQLLRENGRAQPPATTHETEQLAAAAVMYVLGTKMYETFQSEPNVQYVIFQYPNAARPDSHFLKVFGFESDHVETPADIRARVDQVLCQERRAHPDRFPSAEILSFETGVLADLAESASAAVFPAFSAESAPSGSPSR